MRIFLPLITLLLFTGCTKENSRDWIVADVTVLSLTDDSPLVRKIQLKCVETGGIWSNTTTTKQDLGWTDANGKIHIEQKVPRGAQYSLGIYTFYQGEPQEYTFVSNKKKNTIEMYGKPYYYYRRRIHNVNCFNEEDSLCLDNFNYYGFNGCTDGIIESYMVSPTTNPGPQKSIQVKVKRNGIVTQSQRNFTLEPEVENVLLIEY